MRTARYMTATSQLSYFCTWAAAKWTFGEMRAISNSPSLIKAIRFGKHKGLTFEEIAKVDHGYLRWLSSNSDDEDILFTIKHWLKG